MSNFRQHADLKPTQETRNERVLGVLLAVAIGLGLAASLVAGLTA